MKTISFQRQAQQDLLQAAQYYDEQLPGLGREFADEVYRNLEQLAENPGMGRVTAASTKTWQMRKFPYGIVYRISDDALIVVAISHHRQKPDYWLHRL